MYVCMYVFMLFGSLRRYVTTGRFSYRIGVHMRMYVYVCMYVCMLFGSLRRYVKTCSLLTG